MLPNTFAQVETTMEKRTADQFFNDLRRMYDLSNHIVNTAVSISLNQRLKVADESEKGYWKEILMAVKSMA